MSRASSSGHARASERDGGIETETSGAEHQVLAMSQLFSTRTERPTTSLRNNLQLRSTADDLVSILSSFSEAAAPPVQTG